MLQSIRLKDFKSFVDEEVTLAPLTVLVGANASGKSNLLDAIRFVQGLGLGFSVLEVLQGRWEAGREVWKGLHGGTAEAIRHGQACSLLATTWSLRNHLWTYQVDFSTQPQPRLLEETFESPELSIKEFRGIHFASEDELRAKRPNPDAEPEYDNFFAANVTKGRSHISSATFFADVNQAWSSEGTQSIRHLLGILKSSMLLRLSSERMRGYASKQALQLGAEGENLSSTLWSLSQSEQARHEWVDWLSELLAPELLDLGFIETELGDVMLALVERDGARTSARSLSDGTLRFLGTLVALRTAPPGSLVLMEEPETGLHPQRVHLLVEYMEAVTKERGIQVITTTHSPQLLQSLSPEGLRNAVLCARVPDHPGTVLRRLGDLPHFDEVSTRSRIDHLFTTGWLERAL